MDYFPNRLEYLISQRFKQKGILLPDDLKIETVANAFDIEIFYHQTSFAFFQGNYKAITLNKHVDSRQQHYEFWHELTHILIHTGDQLKTAKYINKYQEIDANKCALFCAMPYHMLQYIDWYQENLLELLLEQFHLPKHQLINRLQQIQTKQQNMVFN
ncbi:ImmA/IrrE family metallo-endopeptidase [Halalkalibacterium halodurans]|uniref:ImmA/IrrE family metallo-endopeptidase n=1 Tax=Halalkalibacterium halodurans TaxID=86665 RepID=UPI001067F902|nr:ImmA/IrrE family metallo-endopeptidase [Halalkalibacterium halodurans]TES47192.1 ImmA/IrrE family metallo-endopeptidase [Halalkalibacterium halodurans]